jgi:ABC-type multidrug transport system fused ATPase/permease subunit
VQGNAVAGMEQAIRDDLYAHLQRLDPAFHDEWQSGQLLSRATTDLSSIRRFAGFGLVFLFISIMTFAAVTGLLISLNWWLGLTTAALFAPVFAFCTRFERRYKILARRSQDQDGDLTTLVEEASTGVRVLKSLGRAPEASLAHLAQGAKLGRTRIEMANLLGTFWSTLNLVPNAVIAIVVVLGALAISHHALTIAGLVAFITLALQLVWPVEALGYVLASGEEAATAAQRVLEIFDTQPEISDGQAAGGGKPAVAAATLAAEFGGGVEHGTVQYEHVAFSYPGAAQAVLMDVNLQVARGETLRIGQAVVLELRRRLFEQLLRLSVSFHESYTSGRVISRQTSDVEAISALFEEGLDGLITAVLALLLVGTGMLLLDWQLALVVLSGFIPLTWLSAWFRRESARAYRRIRETNAMVIAFFVETFGGLRAVQAFRRGR